MTRILTTSALALALSGGLAMAGPTQPAPSQVPHPMAQQQAGQSGTAGNSFDAWDTNHDGVLSRSEYQHGMASNETENGFDPNTHSDLQHPMAEKRVMSQQ